MTIIILNMYKFFRYWFKYLISSSLLVDFYSIFSTFLCKYTMYDDDYYQIYFCYFWQKFLPYLRYGRNKIMMCLTLWWFVWIFHDCHRSELTRNKCLSEEKVWLWWKLHVLNNNNNVNFFFYASNIMKGKFCRV